MAIAFLPTYANLKPYYHSTKTTMEQKPFLIQAFLESPVIISPEAYLTLDSLLSASCQLNGDDDSSLPLKKTHDVYHASAGILVGNPVLSEITFISRMTTKDYGDKRIIPNKKKGLVVSLVAFPYKARLDAYPAHHVQSVVWFGVGDPIKTLEIISRLTGIGKRHNSGFGQVREFSLTEINHDYSFKLPNNTVARPIPLPLCLEMGIDTATSLVDMVTYRPNYYDFDNAKMCAIPTIRQIPEALVSQITDSHKEAS